MTTRKGKRGVSQAFATISLGLAGCATPGPLHIYSLAGAPHSPIRDQNENVTVEIPSFVREGESVTAFAYDPYTDHFFLVLQPSNIIRVVDRPARAVKREFPVPGTDGKIGELAVKPRTGHLFLLEPEHQRITELTRLGEFVRHVPLPPTSTPCAGLAYDGLHDHWLLLHPPASGRPTVIVTDLAGMARKHFTLDRDVLGPIGFDAEARELYAVLPSPAPESIGVFDEAGRLLRTVKGAGGLLDLGPRSFIRVF